MPTISDVRPHDELAKAIERRNNAPPSSDSDEGPARVPKSEENAGIPTATGRKRSAHTGSASDEKPVKLPKSAEVSGQPTHSTREQGHEQPPGPSKHTCGLSDTKAGNGKGSADDDPKPHTSKVREAGQDSQPVPPMPKSTRCSTPRSSWSRSLLTW